MHASDDNGSCEGAAARFVESCQTQPRSAFRLANSLESKLPRRLDRGRLVIRQRRRILKGNLAVSALLHPGANGEIVGEQLLDRRPRTPRVCHAAARPR